MRRVLIADADSQVLSLLGSFLAADGHVIQSANDLDSALHRIRAWKPHLILIDADIPKSQDVPIISRVRTLTQDEYTAVVLLSEKGDLQDIVRGLEMGADDYLVKPFRAQDLITRVRLMFRLKETQDALKRANHRIEELSCSDDLTGLMSMKAVYRRGDEEILRSKKYRKPVSALLINLDGFSGVNQTYGFVVGSHILQEVAIRIKQCLRANDLVARVGADEFFIFLNETDLAGAEFIAERIRDSIQSTSFKSEKQVIKLTATVGVGGLIDGNISQRMSDLLHISTEALRSAKANGTNRIEVYSFA